MFRYRIHYVAKYESGGVVVTCVVSIESEVLTVFPLHGSGTNTTNVTQTRVTHRPHVHVTPLNVPGMGMNQFDPFLPCQSHHIRPATRRRHQAQTQVSTHNSWPVVEH